MGVTEKDALEVFKTTMEDAPSIIKEMAEAINNLKEHVENCPYCGLYHLVIEEGEIKYERI